MSATIHHNTVAPSNGERGGRRSGLHSPTLALTWEIWRRGRRCALGALACLASSALLNLLVLHNLPTTDPRHAPFTPLFGLLMTLSFLFLMGMLNYTEFNSTKEWNGFPYRLFALPITTFQLVALPMILGVASVELVYLAWIKLVWTRSEIVAPGWFAVILGAYAVFYQATLWGLAGFRILRLIALGLGGVSSIALAAMPFLAPTFNWPPWVSQKFFIVVTTAAALIAFLTAWTAVSRQRHGGGRRRDWLNALSNRILDAIPRPAKAFSSPAAAQFWFEWRRAGWLLPVCTGFTLLVLVAPISWACRANPQFTVDTLVKIAVMPVILAFAIGKGFVKPEFWSTNLALPTFVAVKPLTTGQLVVARLKVAALSALVSWLFVLGFIAFWLPLWANLTHVNRLLFQFRMFYPHSWKTITILYLAGLMVLTWRCLVTGLWAGLSGKRSCYLGSICLQIAAAAWILTAFGIFSDTIDAEIRDNPLRLISIAVSVSGWLLALAVIGKLWLAAISWKNVSPRRARQYLLLWSGATLCFVTLGILSPPWPDIYRLEHLYVLAAFLLFPFARLGFAPATLARNRHR